MALQNSLTLPASTVALKGLTSWPMIFLSSCIARFLLRERKTLSPTGQPERGWRFRRLLEAADDGHARHVLARRAAEIVGHGDLGVLELAGAGAALELQVH